MHFKQRNRLITLFILILAGIYTFWQENYGKGVKPITVSQVKSEQTQSQSVVTSTITASSSTAINKASIAENVDSTAQVKETEQSKVSGRQSFYDTDMSRDRFGQNTTASVDYYGLVLSWSPAFCEQQRERYGSNLPKSVALQCGSSKQYGWVVHGLWAQNSQAKKVNQQPRFCQGDLPPVKQSILTEYLSDSPSYSLLQGEWEKHGACIFPQAKSYFEKQHQLYRSLKLPDVELSKNVLLKWLKQHNPLLNNRYIDVSHNEIMVCYDKSWQIMSCPH